MKKTTVLSVAAVCLVLALGFAIAFVIFQSKEEILTCEVQSNYLHNKRTYNITYRANKAVLLENIASYEARTTEEASELNTAYNQNLLVNEARKQSPFVTYSNISKTTTSFTLSTKVNVKEITENDLKQIDGYYELILRNNDTLKKVKSFLINQGFTCRVK